MNNHSLAYLGKGSFDTDHFSTFAVFFEDPNSPSGSGFPIGAVIAIVVVAVVAIGAVVFFFLKKKSA